MNRRSFSQGLGQGFGHGFGRRRFLRGAGGVAVGLPFLEGLASKRAWAAPPKRLAIFFECNGVLMEKFFPAAYGALTPASLAGTSLEPLKDHASKLLIPRGIHMVPRGFGRDPGSGDDHMKGMGQKLTCTPNANPYPSGPSLDQVVAKGINPGGKGPLNLQVGGGNSGVLASAFYTASGQPAPMIKDPWRAYKDWMGSGTTTGTMTVDTAAARRKSVLDVVRDDLEAINKNTLLSASDKQKLDLHFTSLRTIEGAMTGGGGGGGTTVTGCNLPPASASAVMATQTGTDVPKSVALMMEIMALAMACDYNRVTTIQIGAGAGGPVYSWLPDSLNKQYNHHKLSHGATSDAASSPTLPTAQWQTSLFNIDTWHMQMLKILLDKMAAYSEPGGSVLDNSAVLYINELSGGLAHSFMDLPIVIAGGAGGYLKQGQYIKMTKSGGTANDTDAPANQLMTTLANAVGYRNTDGTPMTNFGKAPTGKPGEFLELKKA
jgi:hypothetical protein